MLLLPAGGWVPGGDKVSVAEYTDIGQTLQGDPGGCDRRPASGELLECCASVARPLVQPRTTSAAVVS